MLSPHELATLLLVKDAPEPGLSVRVTPRGDAVLRAMARAR
jgi:hypothetical protein